MWVVGVILLYHSPFTVDEFLPLRKLEQMSFAKSKTLNASPLFHSILFPCSLWEILFASTHEKFSPT